MSILVAGHLNVCIIFNMFLNVMLLFMVAHMLAAFDIAVDIAMTSYFYIVILLCNCAASFAKYISVNLSYITHYIYRLLCV